MYHYDLEDPDGYGSYNNRLMYYQTLGTAGQSSTLLSTTWYYYNEFGNPERVVTESTTDPGMYSATRFGFAKNRSAVAYMFSETRSRDGAGYSNQPGEVGIADSGHEKFNCRPVAPIIPGMVERLGYPF